VYVDTEVLQPGVLPHMLPHLTAYLDVMAAGQGGRGGSGPSSVTAAASRPWSRSREEQTWLHREEGENWDGRRSSSYQNSDTRQAP
jgi:hypothetical protein